MPSPQPPTNPVAPLLHVTLDTPVHHGGLLQICENLQKKSGEALLEAQRHPVCTPVHTLHLAVSITLTSITNSILEYSRSLP